MGNFDFGAELNRVTETQNLARRLGAAQMGTAVWGWATKHAAEIPLTALTELMAIITEAK